MFSYPALLWFLPLLGLVVLIHLINMFRHRRVPWAATEFLLAGYRKSRMRILMQQLLLLLLRTLAIALVILMLAQPRLEGPLAEWLGSRPIHHIVLLDDSYSMNDRNTAQGGMPIFEDALAVIRRIVDGAVRRGSNDRLTLVRLSRAVAVEKGEDPDLAEIPLNSEGLRIVEEFLRDLEPSESAAEPEQLLAAIAPLLGRAKNRNTPTAYFLSDFRNRNWEDASGLLEKLRSLRRSGCQVRMIRVSDGERSNLSIDDLAVVEGIHASGIDLLLDATLTNHGRDDLENIHLVLQIDGVSQPGLTVPRIKAGETTVPPIRFSARLDDSKPHQVELQLPPDAIPDDNHRFAVLEVPEALEVLLIVPRGQLSMTDAPARYVRVALSPAGLKSGIRTRIEEPSFLVSHPLDGFAVIFLLEIPAMDPAAIRVLEDYVNSGGGLAMFVGPESNLDFIRTEMVRNGTGLFPRRPIAETILEPDYLSRTTDLLVTGHPIFRLFGEGENALLGNVRIEKYLAVESGVPESDKVLAQLRGGAPLVLEKNFGRGRTVTFLTTAAPNWNNWGRGNPSYVVVLLELTAWLARRPQETNMLLVDDPLEIRIDPSVDEPKARLRLPPREIDGEGDLVTLDFQTRDEKSMSAIWTRTGKSGFYRTTLRDRSGNERERLNAVNVRAGEGDTRLADLSELSALLGTVNLTVESAAGFSVSTDFTGERPLSDMLLLLLVFLLVGEIFLAGRILPPSAR